MRLFFSLFSFVVLLSTSSIDAFWWTSMGKCPETPVIANYTAEMVIFTNY